MDKFQRAIVYIRSCTEMALDISGGAAVGLWTLVMCFAVLRGHDVGMWASTAYSVAVGAFAATVIKNKGSGDGNDDGAAKG